MRQETVNPAVCVSIADLLDMRHQLPDIPLFSGPGRSPLVGLHRSRLRGRGIEFDRVRSYQPGDDVRTIDWRITARTGEPHTRLYQEERERPVFVVVEQSPAMFFGSAHCFKSVLAARCAALFGWAALQHNDRVGGLVYRPGDRRLIRPRRNRRSLLQLLGHITEFNRNLPALPLTGQANSELPAALRRAREALRPGSLLVLVCDERALDAASERLLLQLGSHCELILLPVSDPLDRALPAAGLLRFCDDEQELNLDSSQQGIRQLWRARAKARRQRWRQIAQRSGALLLRMDTANELIESLRVQMQRRPT